MLSQVTGVYGQFAEGVNGISSMNCWRQVQINLALPVSTTRLQEMYKVFLVVMLLTHWSLDKMAAILADDIFKWIFLNENGRIQSQIVPKSAIDNMPPLVQVMAWCRTGDKPLPKPMMTHFTTATLQH